MTLKMHRNFWLMKSEPDVYSFAQLAKDHTTPWEGVRNYEARNHMMRAHINDGVLFYHSNAKPPGIVGLARVTRIAYPDPTQFNPASPYFDAKATLTNPRWFCVDVAYDRPLLHSISLDTLRSTPTLQSMVLLQRGRLSVQPITAAEWRTILQLGGITVP